MLIFEAMQLLDHLRVFWLGFEYKSDTKCPENMIFGVCQKENMAKKWPYFWVMEFLNEITVTIFLETFSSWKKKKKKDIIWNPLNKVFVACLATLKKIGHFFSRFLKKDLKIFLNKDVALFLNKSTNTNVGITAFEIIKKPFFKSQISC